MLDPARRRSIAARHRCQEILLLTRRRKHRPRLFNSRCGTGDSSGTDATPAESDSETQAPATQSDTTENQAPASPTPPTPGGAPPPTSPPARVIIRNRTRRRVQRKFTRGICRKFATRTTTMCATSTLRTAGKYIRKLFITPAMAPLTAFSKYHFPLRRVPIRTLATSRSSKSPPTIVSRR